MGKDEETDGKFYRFVDEEIGFHWTPKGHNMMTYSIQHYLAK
ncbi:MULTISPECIES: hypothetical protein [Bacillaceae]|nr:MULTISPECIES: hypothetical protein [Bacillaceae]